MLSDVTTDLELYKVMGAFQEGVVKSATMPSSTRIIQE